MGEKTSETFFEFIQREREKNFRRMITLLNSEIREIEKNRGNGSTLNEHHSTLTSQLLELRKEKENLLRSYYTRTQRNKFSEE